jgi:hypothetical protein
VLILWNQVSMLIVHLAPSVSAADLRKIKKSLTHCKYSHTRCLSVKMNQLQMRINSILILLQFCCKLSKRCGGGGEKRWGWKQGDSYSMTAWHLFLYKGEAGTWDILQVRGGNRSQWSFKHDCGTLGIKEKAEGQRK